LSAAVLLVWMALFPPQPTHPTPDPNAAAPSAAAETSAAPSPPPETSLSPAPGASAPSLAGVGGAGAAPAALPDVPSGRRLEAAAEEEVAIDTPLETIRLTNRGARVTSWQLKNYLHDPGHPLELVSRAGPSLDHLPLQFLLDDPDATDRLKKALFRVSRREGQEDGHDFTEIALAWSDGQGLAATKTLRVRRDSYLADLKFAAEAGGKGIEPTLVWGAGFGAHNGQESGRYADTSWGVFDSPGLKSPQKRPQASLKPGQPWLEEGAVAWAGVEDKYFAAVFVPPGPEPVERT